MLPVMAIMLIGILDMGLLIREHQIVQNAAREGARFSSLPENDVCCTNPTATLQAVKDRVTGYLAQENITVDSSNVSVNQSKTMTMSGGITAYASEVTVSYTRDMMILGAPFLSFGTVTLTGTAVYRNLYAQCSSPAPCP
jgi:galactitol-specific phosphotransferase system IIB component